MEHADWMNRPHPLQATHSYLVIRSTKIFATYDHGNKTLDDELAVHHLASAGLCAIASVFVRRTFEHRSYPLGAEVTNQRPWPPSGLGEARVSYMNVAAFLFGAYNFHFCHCLEKCSSPSFHVHPGGRRVPRNDIPWHKHVGPALTQCRPDVWMHKLRKGPAHQRKLRGYNYTLTAAGDDRFCSRKKEQSSAP
jgi:hypothetical protein